ncbi:hypothetical protein BDE02_15G093300 [Populus trichocarpa]|nr:hypothetical protein BDE02_15G093300 [Populus trichocarpa]
MISLQIQRRLQILLQQHHLARSCSTKLCICLVKLAYSFSIASWICETCSWEIKER